MHTFYQETPSENKQKKEIKTDRGVYGNTSYSFKYTLPKVRNLASIVDLWKNKNNGLYR